MGPGDMKDRDTRSVALSRAPHTTPRGACRHPEVPVKSDVERELLRKCRGGDARFYEPLVRAYEPQGLRLALGMMGNMEDAQDAL